jgi:nicotinamidase-related amidase
MSLDPGSVPSLTMLDGPMPEPELEQERTLLLIIDMQRYAADPAYGLGRRAREQGLAEQFAYYFAQVEAAVPVIAGVIDACRAAGVQVAHLISEGRTADGRDLSREYRKRNVMTVRGAPDSAIRPELEPREEDLVFRKTTAGGFASTDLDFTLRSLGIETLVVAGVATNQCVESTVREASHLGYDVVLLQDGCATYSPEWQSFSLQSMADQFATLRQGADIATDLCTR